MEKSERYARGWSKLQEIDGEVGLRAMEVLKQFSPELVQFIVEYSFGDVYSLECLNNKAKEVVALSSLIAQGSIAQQKIHFYAALNVGCSIVELKEIVLQMSVYAGFPKCINAMNTLMSIVEEQKNEGLAGLYETQDKSEISFENRYIKGAEVLYDLDKWQVERMENYYKDFAPELVRFTLEYAFADIHSRQGIDRRFRQIATIAALVTQGNAVPQLKFHINGAINIGLKVEELKEIMLLLSVYAGFPAAINGMNALRDVIAERDK